MNLQTGDWITAREAADLAGLSYRTVCLMVQRGAVRTLKIPGSRPRIDRMDFARLIEKSTQPATMATV
jgi:excisionase family DNA binding protein